MNTSSNNVPSGSDGPDRSVEAWRDKLLRGLVLDAEGCVAPPSGRSVDAQSANSLEEDLRLNRLLNLRPMPGASTDMAARVLSEIRALESAEGARVSAGQRMIEVLREVISDVRRMFSGTGLRWTGALAVLALMGIVWFRQPEGTGSDSLNAKALEVTYTASISGLEVDALANFDAIHRMNASARPEDDDLILALMQ